MREIQFPGGARIAQLGQGTWRMGENRALRQVETSALRLGVELGMSLIDTAEMYGEGETELFLGEALAGLREKVFLVSKAYPHHVSRRGLELACEASLRRLKTDRLDLYLLHWRGEIALAETIAGMESLIAAGKIAAWGVSNFDPGDIDELIAAGGEACAANQILYNVARRGPEFDLLPALAERKIVAMAYSPVEQGRLPAHAALAAVARRHDASPTQIALAWALRRPEVLAIPKAATLAHVRENRRAADIVLTPEDCREIDVAFPPPRRSTPLDMI
jgi:diketogulonate reductase-like aldo/keto reductase